MVTLSPIITPATLPKYPLNVALPAKVILLIVAPSPNALNNPSCSPLEV